MKHTGTQTIETERLILRRFTINDAPYMFKNYCNSEKVCKFLPWAPHGVIENTVKFLTDVKLPNYEKENFYSWAVVLKETNEVVGSIDSVSQNDSTERVEFGWVIGDAYWSKGYMTEAAKKILDFFKKVGYTRIEAKFHSENIGSGRVMEKIGMQYEGTLRHYSKTWKGEWYDSKMYSLIVK